jgi:hypothetical protein
VRNRLGIVAVAALVVVLASLTLVAHGAGSSPTADGAGVATAQVTQPAPSPIQQLAFDGREEPRRSGKAASIATVGPPGETDGHMAAGYCRLQYGRPD